jgi:acyl-CoA hydrolase
MISSINDLRHSLPEGPKWRNNYDAKRITMEQAAGLVYSNDNVFVSGNAASPRTFLKVLAQRAQELKNVSVFHLLLLGNDPFDISENNRDRIRHVSFFVGRLTAKLLKNIRLTIFRYS